METLRRALERDLWPLLLLATLFLSPILLFDYLPLTDLPQHMAIVQVLSHLDDPRFGYADWYEVDWGRSFYVFTYLLMLGLSQLTSLITATKLTVFLSSLCLPLGVGLILRGRGQPVWLAVLMFPFLYNNPFFWGFVALQMGVGLALTSIALLGRPHGGVLGEVLHAVLVSIIAICHPYGVAMVLGYLICVLPTSARATALSHRLPIGALLLWLGLWFYKGSGVITDTDAIRWGEGVYRRWVLGPRMLTAAYGDSLASMILVFTLGLMLLATAGSMARIRAAARELSGHERALWAFAALNLLLYYTMPMSGFGNGLLYFRHLVIAALLASSALSWRPHAATRLAFLVCLPLVLGSIGYIHFFHFRGFDAEARRFDEVIAAVPLRSRFVTLNFEHNGQFMNNTPYRHFASYIQVERGGLNGFDFAQQAWQMPVRPRADVVRPRLSRDFDVYPKLPADQAQLPYFDHLVVRAQVEEAAIHASFEGWPYELILSAPPWYVMRRTSPPPGEVSPAP